MLILFDQATPVPLRPFLKGHLVRTAAEQGWDRLRNGDLINAAESGGFDLLVTTDRNMRHQQHITGRRIAVMTLSRQQWPELRAHVQQIIDALKDVNPGTFIDIDIPGA